MFSEIIGYIVIGGGIIFILFAWFDFLQDVYESCKRKKKKKKNKEKEK